jgi:hypothetical protein
MLDIVEKWEKTRLLTGIDDNLKADTAYVLENQIHYNGKILKETTNVDYSDFRRFSVPLVRRVFPCLESHHKYNISAKPSLASCLVEDLGVPGIWGINYAISRNRNDDVLQLEAVAAANLAASLVPILDHFIESQNPFQTFYFQCFGTNEEGNVFLYYDLD